MSELKTTLGWIECKISDLGEIITGKTPNTKVLENFGGDIPFIKPGDLSYGGYISSTAVTLTEKGLASIPTLPIHTLTITCIGNLGKVGITTTESATNQQINSVIPHKYINYKFLYYYLTTIKPWLEKEASATTIAIINKGKFSKAPVKLPPLAEQQQIANKLDELLAQVDTIKSRLDNIPEILKRFRQSVLAAAVSGKLTEDWYSCNNTPRQTSCLKKLGKISGGKTPSKSNSEFWENGNIPWVSPKDMKFLEIKTSIDKITKLALTDGGMKLVPTNSILMVTRSGILAHSFPVAITKVDVTINQDIKAFVPDTNKIIPFFASILMRGLSYTILNECSKTGTTVSSVETSLLANLEFVLPSIEEQTEIITQVEKLFTYADKIEQQVKEAQTRVDNLTQSILAKAFRGELTADWRAQNPDLISGENSAAALLEKIKAEREKLAPAKKTRKKSKV